MMDEKREAEKVGSSLSQQPMPRGMGHRGNMRVVEKPKNFKMAIKRLTEYMKEYSFLLVLAIGFRKKLQKFISPHMDTER